MTPITNVGQLRAALTGLGDEVPVRAPLFPWVAPQDGVWVLRFAAGTCGPEYVELHVQKGGFTA